MLRPDPSTFCGQVWYSRLEDIAGAKKPSDILEMVYSKKVRPKVEHAFDQGATLIEITERPSSATAAGLTNRSARGVAQWRALEDIPPENIKVIRSIPGGKP